MRTVTVFDLPHTRSLNHAELTHLASLGLPLKNRTVLEVGAGVGKLTHFFEDRGCAVLSTDGRPENVAELVERHPRRRAMVVDLMEPGSHDRLGGFDVVFCYGVLYHVGDPARVIGDLARACKGLLLLSTCVHPTDDGENHRRWEHSGRDQSLDHNGCRPARDWVMGELGKHFPFVYATVTQPNHPQYRLEWPAEIARDKDLVRAVFVASRTELALPSLSPSLLLRQRRGL